LVIGDVERLREDLHGDHILPTKLKTITGGLATTCGKFMAIASLVITTLKHIRQAPRKKTDKMQEIDEKQLVTLEKNFTMYFAKKTIKVLYQCRPTLQRTVNDCIVLLKEF